MKQQIYTDRNTTKQQKRKNKGAPRILFQIQHYKFLRNKANQKNRKCIKEDGRIQNGVMKPNEPRENGTMGGTGPLNIEAACKVKTRAY